MWTCQSSATQYSQEGKEKRHKKQQQSDGCDFESAGSLSFPSRPCSSAAFVSREASGCCTSSATPGTVPFRCDTRPSRAGSTALSGPVGRGGERVEAAAAAAELRGRFRRQWPCSSLLRPWVVAAAAQKAENDDSAGTSAELGGGEGVCEKGRECLGRWGEGPRVAPPMRKLIIDRFWR